MEPDGHAVAADQKKAVNEERPARPLASTQARLRRAAPADRELGAWDEQARNDRPGLAWAGATTRSKGGGVSRIGGRRADRRISEIFRGPCSVGHPPPRRPSGMCPRSVHRTSRHAGPRLDGGSGRKWRRVSSTIYRRFACTRGHGGTICARDWCAWPIRPAATSSSAPAALRLRRGRPPPASRTNWPMWSQAGGDGDAPRPAEPLDGEQERPPSRWSHCARTHSRRVRFRRRGAQARSSVTARVV